MKATIVAIVAKSGKNKMPIQACDQIVGRCGGPAYKPSRMATSIAATIPAPIAAIGNTLGTKYG